ncbi:MAG: hypothetical protein AB1490_09375 [Pseudomonadota bacterium]
MTNRARLLITILAAAVALLPSVARSEPASTPPCGERARVIDAIQNHWVEFPIGRGLSADGRALEIYVGPAGSWTIIATTPEGVTCLVAVGEAWETIAWHTTRLAPH